MAVMTGEPEADFPPWTPRPDLNATDLACTLEHIRRVAYLHWIGGAFDPDHMRDIANAAAQALCGEPIEAPVDLNSPEWRGHVREQSDAWIALCDDSLVAIGSTSESDNGNG